MRQDVPQANDPVVAPDQNHGLWIVIPDTGQVLTDDLELPLDDGTQCLIGVIVRSASSVCRREDETGIV